MSSLAAGRGLEDLELWLAGLFTAAELAAAELLLQLRAARAGDEAAAEAEASATPSSSSPRWVSPWGEDLLAVQEKQQQVVEETAWPLVSTELDRRARKRYRFISDIYAATSPVTAATAAAKKRKTHHHGDARHESPSIEERGGDEVRGGEY